MEDNAPQIRGKCHYLIIDLPFINVIFWRKEQKRYCLTMISLCTLLNERSAYWTTSRWSTFRSSCPRTLRSEQRAPKRRGSFISSQGCALMEAHIYKTVWMQHAGRCSPAHSGCCCPSGLGSGPAVTSSLCLCYRWCMSSLGFPAFC